jgi:chromosome segregation ATPase
MVLSPAVADAPGTRPATTQPVSPPRTQAAPGDAPGLSDVHIDQAKVDRLRAHWDAEVAPHREALREAAQAHYGVINELRHEQQRLIDEADRIQRTIDELEKAYADMTTPQPESTSQP